MRCLKYLALIAVLIIPAGFVHSQVAVGVGFGPGYGYVGGPPVCRYGYYDYYPYACAPYGYYGPDWFVGGVFIGAGRGTTAIGDTATGDAPSTDAVVGATVAASMDAATMEGEDTTAVDAAITAEPTVADMPTARTAADADNRCSELS